MIKKFSFISESVTAEKDFYICNLFLNNKEDFVKINTKGNIQKKEYKVESDQFIESKASYLTNKFQIELQIEDFGKFKYIEYVYDVNRSKINHETYFKIFFLQDEYCVFGIQPSEGHGETYFIDNSNNLLDKVIKLFLEYKPLSIQSYIEQNINK